MRGEFYPYRKQPRPPVHTNVWWDDSKPSKVLYGPKGEVLKTYPGREIGFKKR
jgi:hypothetical protein